MRLLDAGAPFDAQLEAFDQAVEKANIESWPLNDRPYLYFAEMNAKAGRTDRAQSWIAKYDAAVRDTALKRWNTPSRCSTRCFTRRWPTQMEGGGRLDSEVGPATGRTRQRMCDVLADGAHRSLCDGEHAGFGVGDLRRVSAVADRRRVRGKGWIA